MTSASSNSSDSESDSPSFKRNVVFKKRKLETKPSEAKTQVSILPISQDSKQQSLIQELFSESHLHTVKDYDPVLPEDIQIAYNKWKEREINRLKRDLPSAPSH